MSIATKRELESPAPDPAASKKRKTSDAFDDHDGDSEPQRYNPKNLLKSGSLPSGKAYQQKQIFLELYLAPVDAERPMEGVERQLDDVLLTYVKKAEGILMGWDNPRFTSRSARVLDESPFLYTRIAVETIIWRPRWGEELEGSIKLMGPSHIGLLILGTFNASIPLTLIPKDWTFEENFEGDDGYWKDSNGTPLAIDQELRFKTVNINKGANILSVEGSLLEQVFQPKYEDGQQTSENVPSRVKETVETALEAGETSEIESRAVRKAEKERRKAEKKTEKKATKSKHKSIH